MHELREGGEDAMVTLACCHGTQGYEGALLAPFHPAAPADGATRLGRAAGCAALPTLVPPVFSPSNGRLKPPATGNPIRAASLARCRELGRQRRPCARAREWAFAGACMCTREHAQARVPGLFGQHLGGSCTDDTCAVS
jgi:hypothetical protein